MQSTMVALADCYDQVVFMQQAVQRAVRATGTPDLAGLVGEAQQVMGAAGSALHAGGAWVTPAPAWLAARSRPETRTFALPDAPGHALAVPFSTGWVAFWDKPTAFTAGDARLAEALADLIDSTEAAFRARAERLRAEVEEHDRRMAANLWRRVVPASFESPAGYDARSVMRPAREVGGDFLLRSADWLVIGDVSGKGVPASMFASMFAASLPLAVEYDDVGAALARTLHAYLEDASMFATLAALRLHPDGCVRYVNLGHPPVLLRRANGEVEALGATAPPLGTFAMPAYRLREVTLQPGDILFLYSDGLSEAERDTPHGTELFGLERARALLEGNATLDGVFHAATEAARSWSVTDDFTVAVVQYRGLP